MKENRESTIQTAMDDVKVAKEVAAVTSLSEKDQTIGSLKEHIASLQKQIVELKEKKSSEEKVKVITKYLPSEHYMYTSPKKTEYVNFDSAVRDLKEDLTKELKIDNTKKENELLEANLQIDRLSKEISIIEREKADTISEAKSELRKKHNKEIERLHQKIDELENDKTAEQLEQKRKEQIEALMERITDLEAQLKGLQEMTWFQRLLWSKAKRDVISAQIKKERETLRKMQESRGAWLTQKDSWCEAFSEF